MSRLLEMSGRRFGLLVVVERSSRKITGVRNAIWTCRCDCGRIKEVISNNLTCGRTRSCGCSYGEQHRKTGTPEYVAWANMWTRCTNPRRKDAKNYMDRGISVCQRWRSFTAFLKDMGEKPSPEMTIERVDNEQGYNPENCVWATPQTASD